MAALTRANGISSFLLVAKKEIAENDTVVVKAKGGDFQWEGKVIKVFKDRPTRGIALLMCTTGATAKSVSAEGDTEMSEDTFHPDDLVDVDVTVGGDPAVGGGTDVAITP